MVYSLNDYLRCDVSVLKYETYSWWSIFIETMSIEISSRQDLRRSMLANNT